MEDSFFELSQDGNLLRIEQFQFPAAHSDCDQWTTAVVMIKAGVFAGSYRASFEASAILLLNNEIEDLNTNLNGAAFFSCLEGYLEFQIKGDGIGHFMVKGTAHEQPGTANELKFTMEVDQTVIAAASRQIDKIARRLQ